MGLPTAFWGVLTYLALADKQTSEHKAACAGIAVDRWREQCLDWDWSDAIIDKKLGAVAGVILQVEDGRGPDIVALQEVENLGILERLRTEYLAVESTFLTPALKKGSDYWEPVSLYLQIYWEPAPVRVGHLAT